MGELRLSSESEAELDDIWLYIAWNSGSEEIATRVVEGIWQQFAILARHPYIGRRRTDLRPGLRSFAVGDYIIIYRLQEPDTVFVVHVLHGSRDIAGLFGG